MSVPNGTSKAVRVIAVGRSAFEPALRNEAGVDLVRVRTPLEAIGEIGGPDHHADRTVVLVGEGLEAPGWTRAAAEGVRLLNAEASILSESRCDPASVDRHIDAAAPDSLDVILRTLPAVAPKTNGVHAHAPAASPSAPVPTPAPAPLPVPTMPTNAAPARIASLMPEVYQATDAAPPSGDPVIEALAALTQGGDVVAALVSAMHADPASAGIEFEPISRITGPGPKGRVFAEVSCRGTAFGRVSGPGAAEALVEAWGRRLTLAHIAALQHRQLREAAFCDPLTGAGNRRFFDRFLEKAMAEAREARSEVTILVFDIDNFKHYNDEYGHAAGDEILVEAVRLLRAVTRPTDQVCRIGGDEFVVIFHEPEGPRVPGSRAPRDVSVIARRFQQQICAHKFPKLGSDARGGLTISGGLATFPWDGDSAESLLARADDLLLASKAAGKNAITLGPGAERACQGFAGPNPGPNT
jgi:diguanylate cyclase (GGDEF)-like protein